MSVTLTPGAIFDPIMMFPHGSHGEKSCLSFSSKQYLTQSKLTIISSKCNSYCKYLDKDLLETLPDLRIILSWVNHISSGLPINLTDLLVILTYLQDSEISSKQYLNGCERVIILNFWNTLHLGSPHPPCPYVTRSHMHTSSLVITTSPSLWGMFRQPMNLPRD